MTKDKALDAPVAAEVKPTTPDQDEIIHVPAGKKRGRFILLILLLVLILTTFTVSDSVVAFFTGQRGPGSTFMTYEHPLLGQRSLTGPQFALVRQSLYKMQSATGRARREPDLEDVAQVIVFDELAQAAGVEVTDQELNERILGIFGSDAGYRQTLKRYQLSDKIFRAEMRREMRSSRYLLLSITGLSVADPAEAERLWKTRHQEYAFDVVAQDVEAMKEEARKLLPANPELETWFKALPAFEQDKYKLAERAKAEVVYRTVGPGVKAEDLVAKYGPAIAQKDPEVRARDYYEGFRHVRFKNPDYKPSQGSFDIEALYQKYEDVKEQAIVESEIYDCMNAWIADMQARGDTNLPVDMLAEAQGFRFGFLNDGTMRPRAEWETSPLPGAGRYVADALFREDYLPGKVHPAVVVEANHLVVVRLVERELARIPDFAEIAAKVGEEWVTKKAADLALAKLEGLRDKFGTRPGENDPAALTWRPEASSEAFAAAIAEAGMKVEHRDFQERFTPLKPGETPSPLNTFLQQSMTLYTLKENTVAKAEAARDGKTAYLVRIAGVRDGDPARMTPLEYESFSQQAVTQGMQEFGTRLTGTREYMKQRFKLHLSSWDEEQPASGS